MSDVRILLVDDESALLALLARHLERSGYVVLPCLSAEAALDAVGAADWRPDLLITDQTLPGMPGSTLAASLLERFPELLGLICSGYPISPDDLPRSLGTRFSILHKPYLPEVLERSVRELVERSRGSVAIP
jgi:DNA-binding response OmpR family regulator